jgi:hypothetical protein
MRTSFLFASLPFLLLASCSSSGSVASPGADAGGDTGASNANPNDISATFGPLTLAGGAETTQCIVFPLSNDADAVIASVEAHLSPGSHHVIVYRTTDMATSDPLTCAPFTGIAIGSDVPLFFANKDGETFSFPAGVGEDLPAHQMVKVEAHYINTTAADLQGHATVTFHTTPKASAPPYQAANFVFYGTRTFSIAPNSTASTGTHFQVGPAGTHFFLVSTHQHHLGTRVQAWASKQPGDLSNQIADDKDWANPSWRTLTPQFDFDGTSGLSFSCDWNNTTGKTVTFGESANDEMCFVGGYYYPSKGFQFCTDGGCRFK